MRETKRYLGLDLAGAKNQKTSLAALEYYPKEQKIFLLDIYEKISARASGTTGDEALLELIQELVNDYNQQVRIGVNVPLELPPCITCTRKTCPLPSHCTVPAVKWMNSVTRKASRSGGEHGSRVLEFTPYTQRPIELWVRYQVLSKLPESYRFEIDETLGGNKAPLTARMAFLKRHLGHLHFTEVWPKLSVAMLAAQTGLDRRTISTYRHLEQGAHARERILETLADKQGIFIYERDVRKLAHSLSSFDAFVCAYTAHLADIGRCASMPSGFPASSGWIGYPHSAHPSGRARAE